MKDQIYEYLKRHRKPLSVPQLAAVLNADNETVRRNVAKLIREGVIKREDGAGRYNVRYVACATRGAQVVPVIKVPRQEGQAARTIRGSLTSHLTEFLHGLCIIKRM